jgi:hypothetical protein
MLNAGSKDPAYTVRAALLVPIAWIYLAGGASAQSADTIVERHVKAIGGKDALERILSTTITGTVTLADGQTGTFIEETKRPNSLHISLAWKDGRWSTGFNGRSAWQDDRRDGLHTLMGRPAASVRADAAYANRDVFTDDGRRQLILVGKNQVRGRPVFVVDAMTHDVFRRTLFFDANTYLLLKEQYETDAGMEIRFFGDYRRVGSVMEPHRIEWQRGDDSVVITITRVTHNAAVDEQVFDFPRSPAAPAIDAVAVLSSAMRNQQKVDELLASYAYTETLTNRVMDQTGRITSEDVTVSEVFYAGGRAVSKLVKRNGRELPDKEKREEQKRVDGIVREYLQHPTRNVLGPGRSLSPDYVTSTYLRMLDFTNPRREQVGGRTAIVFDVRAKRDAQPGNDVELAVTKWAGTFWIDERAQQLMRSTVHYTDAHKIFFLEGSWSSGEQTLVNNEVWLPSFGESQRTGAFGLKFIDKRFYHRATTQYSDYRKFNVESDYKVTLPEVK